MHKMSVWRLKCLKVHTILWLYLEKECYLMSVYPINCSPLFLNDWVSVILFLYFYPCMCVKITYYFTIILTELKSHSQKESIRDCLVKLFNWPIRFLFPACLHCHVRYRNKYNIKYCFSELSTASVKCFSWKIMSLFFGTT